MGELGSNTDADDTLLSEDAFSDTRAELIAPTIDLSAANSVSVAPSVETKASSSPQEAMRRQEVRRIRAFVAFTSLMCIMTVILVPFLGGDPIGTWLLVGSSAVCAVVSFFTLFIIADESRYRLWMSTAFSLVAATAVVAGYYFFGVTSALMMLVPLGTYLLAMGESFSGALVSHVYVSLSHAVLSVLQIAGVLPEVAIVQIIADDVAQQVGMLMATQTVLLATFIMARKFRQSTFETIEKLNQEIADNARREALLFEAKQELALARKVGGPGRFSEQTLGSFRLSNVIGRGAMGEVYGAVHIESGELAAIKLLSPDALARPSMVQRFQREIRIAQELREQNIVRVLQVSGDDAPMPFIAMERLRGMSLSARMDLPPRLSRSECSELMQALARGAHAAHEAGIVHRDLKPANIFCHRSGDRPVWKILDFGVSKFMDQGDTLTSGSLVGTPSYMAPEQAQGQKITRQADIYALGVIAYRILTGRPAFGGREVAVVLHSVVYDMPPRPSEISELSPAYDCVLAIAMAKRPKDRFANAIEFAEALKLAEEDALPPALLDRGITLVSKYPWGQRLRRAASCR